MYCEKFNIKYIKFYVFLFNDYTNEILIYSKVVRFRPFYLSNAVVNFPSYLCETD